MEKRKFDMVWAPLVSGFLIFIPGILGVVLQHPWLFPSLAPTAFLTSLHPQRRNSRLYNVIVGHFIAIGIGFAVVLAFGAQGEPSSSQTHRITYLQLAVSVVAVVITKFLHILTQSSHPAAGSTSLLISLGEFKPNFTDVYSLIIGVLIVGVVGNIFREIRLRKFPEKD